MPGRRSRPNRNPRHPPCPTQSALSALSNAIRVTGLRYPLYLTQPAPPIRVSALPDIVNATDLRHPPTNARTLPIRPH